MCRLSSIKHSKIRAEGSPTEAIPRVQARVALALLVLIAFLVLSLDALSRSARVASWLYNSEQRICRQTRKMFVYKGYFPDFEDRLVNEELPAVDYSKGGVYLFGTSNLETSTRFWELPEPERALLHNFGIPSTGHRSQLQFLRYLIEQRGMLRAGGEKTMVIFGLSYHDCGSSILFGELWKRHGLYRYDPVKGITPVAVNPAWKFLHFERLRISGCLDRIAHGLFHLITWRWHDSDRTLNPSEFNRLRKEWFGPDWQNRMQDEIEVFARTIDYLRARNVCMRVVLLPQGTWEDNLPFERAYKEQIGAVCRSHGVTVLDWSKMLDDEDFADSNHPNLYGMDKLQDAFLRIGLPFLRSTGALP